ncbi:hypothetical protein BDY24DRAFT_400630 [Mrakia frigida]|uniref:uncharacterized protein n=1 Tax=Mrakia frigida TaxID=29902 RepID=UPI003FCBF200
MDDITYNPGLNPGEQRDAKEKVLHHGRRVSYFYDHDVGNYSFSQNHPMKPHRMRITHNIVTAYGLIDKMDVLRPKRATPSQITRFHTDDYVDFLLKVTPETVNELTGHGTRYMVGDDCPAFEGVFEFCSISAGGSISAAERLNLGACETAINWAGGLHHAKKREASGFCYVNDIVLGILELLRVHPRVLYIDIDVHHGDGVEEAFFTTDRVFTCSFHQFDGNFFPGSGDVRDVGYGKGKNYAANIPLRDGIDDESYASIFKPVVQHIMDWYQPGAVVIQCGGDSLAGDKLGSLNLSMKGHGECVKFVQDFGLPTMLLGGGGYTVKNVARTWANETAIVLGEELDEDMPYNEYFEYFGPRFKLESMRSNMDNQNSPEYLENIKTRIIESLRSMPFAPSVGMHEVPSISVGEAIRVVDSEEGSEDEDDVDVQISHRLTDIHRSSARKQAKTASMARQQQRANARASQMDVDGDDEEDHHHHHDQNHTSPPDFFSSTSRFQQSFASRPPILYNNSTGNASPSISLATVAEQMNIATNGRNGSGAARRAGGRSTFARGREEVKKQKRNFFAGGSPLPVLSGGEGW